MLFLTNPMYGPGLMRTPGALSCLVCFGAFEVLELELLIAAIYIPYTPYGVVAL
jgi:hypothetical protein